MKIPKNKNKEEKQVCNFITGLLWYLATPCFMNPKESKKSSQCYKSWSAELFHMLQPDLVIHHRSQQLPDASFRVTGQGKNNKLAIVRHSEFRGVEQSIFYIFLLELPLVGSKWLPALLFLNRQVLEVKIIQFSFTLRSPATHVLP